jgi:hypothetical protein
MIGLLAFGYLCFGRSMYVYVILFCALLLEAAGEEKLVEGH